MAKTNLQKKNEIDTVIARYKLFFADLKKKRNKIVANFVEALRHKRLEEIKRSLSKD